MANKEIQRLVKDLERQGWRVELRGTGHYMAFPPDKSKEPVVFASTPSDGRWMKNTLARLRKSGYKE